MTTLFSIDIGCGTKKRPGSIGIDQYAAPGIDHVVDLATSPLPFPDNSVGTIFSSHFIEHMADVEQVFREITRVAAHGATIELWHPYSQHRDAFLLGHRTPLNESTYVQMSSTEPAYWAKLLGARWIVEDLVFAIAGEVLEELAGYDIGPDFAVRYLSNVVTELGVFGRIDKQSPPPARGPMPRRLYAVSRKPEDRHPLVAAPPARGFADRLRRFMKSSALTNLF
jgi:SAM-dependent methyltransferase